MLCNNDEQEKVELVYCSDVKTVGKEI